MNKDNIKHHLYISVLENYIGDLDLKDNMSVQFVDLGIDSLDFVEMIMKIEEEFDIFINNNEFKFVKNINQLINLIYMKLSKE